MQWVRVRLRAFRVFAACVTAAQALAIGVLGTPSHAMGAGIPGAQMVICTARGAVVIPDNGTPTAPGKQQSKCPCCVSGCPASAAKMPALIPIEIGLIAPPQYIAARLISAREAFVRPSRPKTSCPRGPPAIGV